MDYEVIEDAPVLLPNANHLNFTTTKDVIKKGAIIGGKEQRITGKRRGEPFQYRLFITDKNQLIHLNKVKPMETTEVTLGADAQVSPTEVIIPSKTNFSKHTIIGSLLGGGVGYWYAKKTKLDNNKMLVAVGAGVLIGFFAGRFAEKKGILVKASK